MKKPTEPRVEQLLIKLKDDPETAKSRAGYVICILDMHQLVLYIRNRRQGLCHERAYSLAGRNQKGVSQPTFRAWYNEALQA